MTDQTPEPTQPNPEHINPNPHDAENLSATDNDDFMLRLAAANPVAGWDLPSASDPSAQQILENAMKFETPLNSENPLNSETPATSAIGSTESYTDHYQRTHVPLADYDGPTPQAPAAPTPMIAERPAPAAARGRSRLMLVSAAAAVLLLFGGLLVFSPDTTPSAVATVHSAAAAAADADSGRIETTFSASGTDGEENGSVEGTFQAAYAGSDIAFTVDVDAIEGAEEFGELPVSEVRLIDDVIYVYEGDRWLALDTDGLLGQMVTDFVDPRSVLQTIQEITETTEIGSATVDGVTTTQYQSVIDLADETLTESGWLGFEGAGIDAEGEITVDLFVDEAGVLRQFDLSGDLQDTEGAGETGTFAVTTRFFDIGSDITVETPADAEVFNPLEGLFED